MKLGLTILRVAVGATFFAHGAQKLFGWFNGPGLEGASQGFDQMGLRPGRRHALVAGVAETGGGALMTVGLFTPLASASLIGVMHQAIRTVHWDKGFFATEGGYEYNLVLIASAFALADIGPGPLSLDNALGTERSGPFWAIAALAAGLAGPRLLELVAPEAPDQGQQQPEEQRFTRDTAGTPQQAPA
jgi:putative oxidoreductase